MNLHMSLGGNEDEEEDDDKGSDGTGLLDVFEDIVESSLHLDTPDRDDEEEDD